MKILYFANVRIPTEKAHGMQIIKMSEAFSAAGIGLELVLPKRLNEPEYKGKNIFDHYRIKKNFQIKKLLILDPIFLLRLPAGIYIKFQALFFIISLFWYLLFKKDKNQYVFYTRDEYLLPVLQLFSKRVIWEGHSVSKNKSKYLKYFKRCGRIIVLTDQLKQKLLELGLDQVKILVAPDAVDLSVFAIKLTRQQARKELNLPPDKLILGYTGSFKTKGADKGIEGILKALKTLSANYKNLVFIAVGGNQEDISYYQKLARQHNLAHKVLFLAPVSQNQLAIFQKAFDVLLMPFPKTEHYAYFMSPMKMFEYMAAERPIVATDLPSVREVLNQNNSILVKPDDPQDLARGISQVITDKKLVQNLSNQAAGDVKQYTWDRRAQNIIQVLNSNA